MSEAELIQIDKENYPSSSSSRAMGKYGLHLVLSMHTLIAMFRIILRSAALQIPYTMALLLRHKNYRAKPQFMFTNIRQLIPELSWKPSNNKETVRECRRLQKKMLNRTNQTGDISRGGRKKKG